MRVLFFLVLVFAPTTTCEGEVFHSPALPGGGNQQFTPSTFRAVVETQRRGKRILEREQLGGTWNRWRDATDGRRMLSRDEERRLGLEPSPPTIAEKQSLRQSERRETLIAVRAQLLAVSDELERIKRELHALKQQLSQR